MKINMYNTKFRAIRGLIVLATLFGLFITGIQSQPDVKDIVNTFFQKEEEYFKHVKWLFGPRDASSYMPGWPLIDVHARALVYVTFLSFWIAVHFKLCELLYAAVSITNLYHMKCKLYYEHTSAAFREFKKAITDSRGQRWNLYEEADDDFEIAVNETERLSLDFVTSAKNLLKEERYEPDYIPGIIRWRKIKRECNVYTIFSKKKEFINILKEVEASNNRYNFIFSKMRNYINEQMSKFVHKIFVKEMIKSDTEFTENYKGLMSAFKNSRFEIPHIENILMVLNQQSSDYYNERISSIKNSINLMEIIRNIERRNILENLP